jgi:hypothetical protein
MRIYGALPNLGSRGESSLFPCDGTANFMVIVSFAGHGIHWLEKYTLDGSYPAREKSKPHANGQQKIKFDKRGDDSRD